MTEDERPLFSARTMANALELKNRYFEELQQTRAKLDKAREAFGELDTKVCEILGQRPTHVCCCTRAIEFIELVRTTGVDMRVIIHKEIGE